MRYLLIEHDARSFFRKYCDWDVGSFDEPPHAFGFAGDEYKMKYEQPFEEFLIDVPGSDFGQNTANL